MSLKAIVCRRVSFGAARVALGETVAAPIPLLTVCRFASCLHAIAVPLYSARGERPVGTRLPTIRTRRSPDLL